MMINGREYGPLNKIDVKENTYVNPLYRCKEKDSSKKKIRKMFWS